MQILGSLPRISWIILWECDLGICVFKITIFLSSPEDMLTDFRERGKKGEREGEKHPLWETPISCLPYAPQLGTAQQPRYVPWLEIKPATFHFMGWRSNQLSHTSQGRICVLTCFSDGGLYAEVGSVDQQSVYKLFKIVVSQLQRNKGENLTIRIGIYLNENKQIWKKIRNLGNDKYKLGN